MNAKTASNLVAALGIFAISGCAGLSSTSTPGSQPTNVKFGFDFAGPNTHLYPMPTGVIAIKSNDARGEAFCEAIVRNMKSVSSIESGSSIAQNIIHTRFLGSSLRLMG